VISTIIFDLGETLVTGLMRVEEPLAAALGLPAEIASEVLRCDALTELFLDRLTEDEYIDEVERLAGRPLDRERVKALIRANFRHAIEGMPAVVGTLAGRYPLVLHSDHARAWAQWVLARHTFLNVFERSFFSFELGMNKRQPETFCAVLGALGAEPEHCLFIDNNSSNVRTAQSVGLHAIHFENAGQLTAALAQHGL
jgi:putative hydrolase of the HAD superfamily